MLSRIARFFTSRTGSYELLPTNASGGQTSSNPTSSPDGPGLRARLLLHSRLMQRIGAFFLITILGLLAVRWYYRWPREFADEEYHGLPTYREIREYERNLPQHDLNLPWPEGKNGRFVLFEVPYNHIGFNNQFQDILMSAQTAFMSNRAYAFQPYLWDQATYKPVVEEDGRWKSATIPLNAFISGPVSGGRFGPGTGTASDGQRSAYWEAPRGVTYEFFDQVCPKSRRVRVSVQDVRKKYDIEEASDRPTGKETLEAFSKTLLAMNDSCVVVGGDHVFTFGAFSSRILPAFDLLQESPIMTRFKWSRLVRGIIARNIKLLSSDDFVIPHPPSSFTPPKLHGTLAVHLRRGDFQDHCKFLASWYSAFGGWNQFPDYIDKLENPWEMGSDAERLEKYMQHCLPTVDQVVTKMREVKRKWEADASRRKLDRVYFLTNAELAYREELKQKLDEDGWKHIAMTYEMVIDKDEVEVDMAADMMIAQLAEVFLGNGFSSLTSNVNLLRKVRHVETDSIRFF